MSKFDEKEQTAHSATEQLNAYKALEAPTPEQIHEMEELESTMRAATKTIKKLEVEIGLPKHLTLTLL